MEKEKFLQAKKGEIREEIPEEAIQNLENFLVLKNQCEILKDNLESGQITDKKNLKG
jgi:hypothetical protein